jgi:hypothetical protein
MAQAISRRPLAAEVRVRALFNPFGICGGQNGTGTGFSPRSSFIRASIIPPLLFIFILIWGCNRGPLVAADQRHNLAPST